MPLREACEDRYSGVRLRLIGDSITWGANTTGFGSYTEPSDKLLTDTRLALTAPSYANLLRDWMAATWFSPVISEQGAGWARYRSDAIIAPTETACATFATGGSGCTKLTGSGGMLGTYVDVMPGTELRFTMIGDSFTTTFAKLPNSGSQYVVLIDGVQLGSAVSLYAASAAFGYTMTHSFAYGTHEVALRNTSANSAHRFRLEAITHHRLFQFANDGIIGTSVGNWAPGGNLLTGALAQPHEHLMICLGTNSRSIAEAGVDAPQRVKDGLTAIIGAMTGKSIILLAPPAVAANGDVEGSPSVYAFPQRDVRRAIAETAEAHGLPFIDLYAPTAMQAVSGIDLVDDNLHPNDAGHAFIAHTIAQALLEA